MNGTSPTTMKPMHNDVKRSTSMMVQLPRPLQPQQGTHGGPVMSCIPYAPALPKFVLNALALRALVVLI